MPTSRTSSDVSSSSSRRGGRASGSEVSSSQTSLTSSSQASRLSALAASLGGSQRDRVEEKPNATRSPRYAGGSGEQAEEEEVEPLLAGSEVLSGVASSVTASGVASSFAQSGFQEATMADMDLSPETRERLNKFKETALQLAVLAAIVGMLGFFVWLLWSQREALKAWWKHTFPPRCEFTEWSDWAPCTRSCGVGTNSADRSYGPKKCSPIPGDADLRRHRQCELEECLKAVHCRLGPWSPWAACTEPCGPGIRSRQRHEEQPPNALGRPCALAFQEWPCEERLCSHFCHLSPWSPWGPCSKSCGRGKMTRHRTAIPKDEIQSGIDCPKEVDESTCNLGECIERSSCHFQVAPRIDGAAPLERCNGTLAEQGCEVDCAVGYEEDRPLLCAGGLRFLRSRCLPTPCGQPPAIAKARPTFRCVGLQSGAQCHVDCDVGFRKTGDLSCHHGHLSAPDCVPDTCGKPPQPSHGAAVFVCSSGPAESCKDADLQERTVANCRGLKHGEVCDFFTCGKGYFKSEPMRCEKFNFNRPRCLEDICQAPPDVPHTVVDFDDGVAKECRFLAYHRLSFPSRATCPIRCQEGHQVLGASFCFRGQWFAAECVPPGFPPTGCKGADAPQVKNAAAVQCPKHLYFTSQVCEVACDEGFRKTGDLLCARDRWLSAECYPAECTVPLVKNAEDLSACAGSPHGSHCQVRCLEGYEATVDHLVCDHGVWTKVLCEPRHCKYAPGAPPFAVGNFTACAGKFHGEYCPVVCEEGFTPVPSKGMRCERGRFTQAACEPNDCPMPLVNHSGDLSDCFRHPSGSICELLCARGYVKAGANLYCDRGTWSPGACWPKSGCGAPPTVAHAESAEIRHCVDAKRGETCEGFRCDVGFEVADGKGLKCLEHGVFSRPRCALQHCGQPTLPPNGRGSQGCEGVPSGGVCRLLCKEGYAPRAAFQCLRGTFLESRCDLVRGLNSYAEDESMTLALHLEVSYTAWTASEASKPSGLRAARLSRALAQEAGLRPWRLVAKSARPYSLSTTVLDLLLLPASYSEDGSEFEDFKTGGTRLPPPAYEALDRAQKAMKNPSDQLKRALRLHGSANIAVKQLEVVSSTVGKMCVHPPVIEHAKDLSECAFTLSGHTCPLVCKAGFVHSGSLACQDGEWLLPQCVELTCDSAPKLAHAEDLGHCKNSASGSMCTIDCQPGYIRTGDIECRQGAWAGASCVPKTCNHVPAILHSDARALRQCQGLASGAECSLRCEEGYVPTGYGKLRCHLGNFQIRSRCAPADCLQIPSVRNSREKLSSCSGLKHGSTYDFECRAGYKKVGWLQCFHGRYTSARCDPAECEAPPTVEHLSPDEAERCAPWPSGKRCNASCPFPRRLMPALRCSHGHWSSSKCVPYSEPGGQPCRKLPVLPRAADLGHCAGRPHGSECEASCIKGYTLDQPLVCLDSLWSHTSCEPLPCGKPPAVEFATSTAACHGQDHGSLCMLFCRSGYSPGGLPLLVPGDISSEVELQRSLALRSLRCHAGEWLNPGCLEAPCDQPPAIPGATATSLRACAGIKSRGLCRFECEGGFVAAGYPECIKGEWSSLDLARCEEAPCSEVPKVRHAKDTRACAGRKSGEICPVECQAGFKLISELRCERGVWVDAECAAYCGLPTEAIGGAISLEHCVNTRVGDSCAVICKPGLHPTGRIRCLAGGRWSEARCFDPAKELMHEVVARVSVEGVTDFADFVDADITQGLEVVAGSFENLLAKRLKVPVELFTSNLTADPSFSRNSFRLELKVMCSELQKAQPLTFHKLSGVPALPGFQENELRAFSDCDKKLEIVNQTVSQTNMKDFRSNICDTFCETSEEPMCEPECLDRVLGFMVFPKTLLLQVMEESAAGKSSHEATTNHETII